MKAQQTRPSEAVFADGRKNRPLAIHPDAIGVSYPTRPVDRVAATIKDGVAVYAIEGPLEHKSGDSWWCYWQNYEGIARDFKTLIDDESVNAIVLKFDSPGGEVSGLNETVALLQRWKVESGKPVIAYVDEACYSAAYALAMVADEIFLPESGGVGSVGVITTMVDQVERDKKEGFRVEVLATGRKKTDHHPHFPLTDGALKRARKGIDKLAGAFFEMVSQSRGLTTEAVAGFEAGVFQGQDGVNVGLADGVMSLAECLTFVQVEFSQKGSPTEHLAKEKVLMTGQVAAAKALSDANAAMAAAKTDADRALCAARIVAAEANLAKVKKTKTKDTTTHTEEVDDGEADEESEDEESEDDSSDSGSSDSDDDSDSGSESESEDEEDEEKKSDNAKSGLYTKDRLLRLARQIVGSSTSRISANKTGKRKMSIEEVMGALHAMWQSHKGHATLAAKVKKLEATVESDKVKALIDRGLKAGKLSPSQKEWARTQSVAGLRAYLDAAPKMVHSADDEHTESRIAGVGVGGVSAEMAKIWLKQGFTEKDFPRLVEKLNATTKSNGAS